MAINMYRVRVAGTGWAGAPSLNTFYFSVGELSTQTAVDDVYTRVRAGVEAMKDIYPTGATHTVSSQVDVLNAEDGEISETWSGTAAETTATPGAGGVLSPPATAYLLKLTTGDFISGRRVIGRAYISPIRASHISSGLTTGPGTAAVVAGATAIKGAPGAGEPIWGVWSRPRAAQTAEEHPPNGVTARTGSFHDITSFSVPTKLAVLRSRRD